MKGDSQGGGEISRHWPTRCDERSVCSLEGKLFLREDAAARSSSVCLARSSPDCESKSVIGTRAMTHARGRGALEAD